MTQDEQEIERNLKMEVKRLEDASLLTLNLEGGSTS